MPVRSSVGGRPGVRGRAGRLFFLILRSPRPHGRPAILASVSVPHGQPVRCGRGIGPAVMFVTYARVSRRKRGRAARPSGVCREHLAAGFLRPCSVPFSSRFGLAAVDETLAVPSSRPGLIHPRPASFMRPSSPGLFSSDSSRLRCLPVSDAARAGRHKQQSSGRPSLFPAAPCPSAHPTASVWDLSQTRSM